jgi:hypothetical protein
VEFVPFPSQLITSVYVEQATACKYETVDVAATVRAQGGGSIKTSINGVPGSESTVQYGTVGKHPILVTATEGALTQTRTVFVEVLDCVSLTPQIAWSPGTKPYSVRFHVDNADELGVETSYEWTFGDGQSAQTLNRSIAHDYSAALTLPNDLDVVASVTARMPDGSSAESSIRIVVRNSYREMAKRGFVRPLVQSDGRFEVIRKELVGRYTVRNIEPEPIVLEQRRLLGHSCDPDLEPVILDPQEVNAQPLLTGDVIIPAQSLVERVLVIPRDRLGTAICSVTEEWTGHNAFGMEVRLGISFETEQPGFYTYDIVDAEHCDPTGRSRPGACLESSRFYPS